MAVTFDVVGPAGGGGAHIASGALSWSHVVAADATMLVVGIATNADGGTVTVTAGGTTMTTNAASNLWKRHTNDSTAGFVQLFVLPSPPTGTITIACSTESSSVAGGSLSFKGTATDSTGYGTPVSAVGFTNLETVDITSTTTGNMIAAVSGSGSSEGGTAVSPSTKRWSSVDDTSGGAGCSGGQTAPAGGTVTMAHNITSDFWTIIAVEIKSGSTDATVIPPARVDVLIH
jgi:hypothetical protein